MYMEKMSLLREFNHSANICRLYLKANNPPQPLSPLLFTKAYLLIYQDLNSSMFSNKDR